MACAVMYRYLCVCRILLNDAILVQLAVFMQTNSQNIMPLDEIIYSYGFVPVLQEKFRSAASLVPGSCTIEALQDVASMPLPHHLLLYYIGNPFAADISVPNATVLYVSDDNYFGDRPFINIHWPIEAIAVILQQALSNSELWKKTFDNEKQCITCPIGRMYKSLLSASPDLVFIISEDGDFVETMASDTSLLIAAPSTFRGHSVYEIVPEQLAPRIRAAIESTFAGASIVELHYELDLPIGKRFFHARFADMHLEINNKRLLVLMSRDCTQTTVEINELKAQNAHYAEQIARYNAEASEVSGHLVQSAQRFDEIARMMPQAIVEIDSAGNVLYVNAHATVLTGYTEDELLKLNVKNILSARDMASLSQRLVDKERGAIVNNTYRIRHKNGYEILVQAISSPLFRNGVFIGRRAVLFDIDEQKRREEILKDQALFMRFNPAPNFKIDECGYIVSCNPAAIKMFKADYAGRHVSQIFPENLLTLEKDKFSFTAPLAGRTFNFYAVRGLYSNYMYFYGSDVTEIIEAQARNQQMLQLQQERLKKLNCLYQISNVIQNPHSELEVIEQVLQKIPESYQFPHIACMRVVYKDIDRCTNNYEATEWKQQSRIYAGKHEVGLLDVRYLVYPGDFFEGPFMQEERQLISAVGFLLGALSRRLQAEAENRMLRKAVEQNPASILICDAELTIEYVNQKYIQSSGYSEEELIGHNIYQIANDRQNDDYYNKMWETVRSGTICHGDVRNVSKNGEWYWERELVSPIYDETGTLSHFVEIKENITQRKQMEEDLRQAMLAAESANRAKSEFLANVSHEIRTPLNSIVGFSDLLQAELHERKLISYLDSIKTSGQNLLSLINDILDLAKIEAGKLDINYMSVDIRGLFNELESMFSLRVQQKQLRFNVSIQNGFPELVTFDELRLKQIIINLLSNAIKFTEQGSIKLSLSYRMLENGDTLEMHIAVEDTGEGIEADQLENIFLSFNQGKDSRLRQSVGTGLGLTISRRLTELMGGSLTAVSEKGSGSTFNLRFSNVPICKVPRLQQTETVHTDCINVRFNGQKVIVVDDQSAERKYVEMSLERVGLQIYTVATPQEVIDMVQQISPDLLITDIVMPEMGGFELAERLHEQMPALPIIAMSASILKYAKRLYGNPHFSSILVKPFYLEELYACVMKILPHEIIIPVEEQCIETAIGDASPELAQLLCGKLYSKWAEFSKQQPIDEVQLFAQSLITTGEEFDQPEIIDFGQSLMAALESFDIELLLTKLREYPVLVEKICRSVALN